MRTKDVLKQFTQADYLKAFRRDLKEPRYLPAVSDMVVASTGEVWVAGAMSVPGRPIRWTILNPDGGIKGAIDLPAMTTVYAAEGDVVVLEHDTSQLVLYRLTGPTR